MLAEEYGGWLKGRSEESAGEEKLALVGSLVLDRFLIERRIGSGGFGVVYEAWDGRLERAVAVKHPLSYLGPLASGIAGIALLGGHTTAAAWLVAGASLAFVAVNVVVVVRQRAAHTVLLLVAALAWAAGSLLHAGAAQAGAVVPWWLAFLVLTIAAERLEMTRLMRRRERASQALYAIFGVMLLGAALSAVSSTWGGVLYGLSLLALALSSAGRFTSSAPLSSSRSPRKGRTRHCRKGVRTCISSAMRNRQMPCSEMR